MDKLIYNSLNGYFCNLKKTGYKNYELVSKLLILDFIYYIFNNKDKFNIDNQSNKLLNDTVDYIIDTSCDIPYISSNCNCLPQIGKKKVIEVTADIDILEAVINHDKYIITTLPYKDMIYQSNTITLSLTTTPWDYHVDGFQCVQGESSWFESGVTLTTAINYENENPLQITIKTSPYYAGRIYDNSRSSDTSAEPNNIKKSITGVEIVIDYPGSSSKTTSNKIYEQDNFTCYVSTMFDGNSPDLTNHQFVMTTKIILDEHFNGEYPKYSYTKANSEKITGNYDCHHLSFLQGGILQDKKLPTIALGTRSGTVFVTSNELINSKYQLSPISGDKGYRVTTLGSELFLASEFEEIEIYNVNQFISLSTYSILTPNFTIAVSSGDFYNQAGSVMESFIQLSTWEYDSQSGFNQGPPLLYVDNLDATNQISIYRRQGFINAYPISFNIKNNSDSVGFTLTSVYLTTLGGVALGNTTKVYPYRIEQLDSTTYRVEFNDLYSLSTFYNCYELYVNSKVYNLTQEVQINLEQPEACDSVNINGITNILSSSGQTSVSFQKV